MHYDFQTNPKVALLRWAPPARRNERTAVRSLARSLLPPSERWRLDAPAGTAPRLRPAPDAAVHYVSLSHTRVAVAAAVGTRAVGVDVESVHRRGDWARIARRHFGAAEQAWLERHAPNQRKIAFLALWTSKEAWLKAQGVGLSCLHSALFKPLRGRRWIVPGQGWHAETRLLDDGLVISVLWQGPGRPLWLQGRTDRITDSLVPAPAYRLRWRGESEKLRS